MKISAIRSDKVYSKIMSAPLDKKNDIYRYELMKPFEKKWACYSVPMKALTPNGYDVIMASWSYVKKKYKLNTTNFLFLCNC